MKRSIIPRTKHHYLNDFAVFILCHGRPENTPSYVTLRKYGYTGPIYIICDDEDTELDNYRRVFGEDVVKVFSKDDVAKYMDPMDNTRDRRCAVYARNACFDIAKDLGLLYFTQWDDDYVGCPYRWEDSGVLYRSESANLDDVFEAYIEFLETSDTIYSVAFGQPGDFIGGACSRLVKMRYRRKCMNSWICKTDRRLYFNGTMNDDFLMYSLDGSRGRVFLTFDFIMIDQPETQQVKGGMTDMYLGAGTYQKTWYGIMACPSFVKAGMMGDRHYRIHHSTEHDNAYPKILSGRYRKDG